MKTMKKALALVLALAIVMSLGISAFAAGNTIVITNPKDSNVNIADKTFTAYEVFKLVSVSGDKYNYDVTEGYKDFKFDVSTKTVEGGNAKSGEELITSLEGKGHDVMVAFAQAAIKYAKDNPSLSINKTSNDGTVEGTFGNEAQVATIPITEPGYYVIEDEDAIDAAGQAVIVGTVAITAENAQTDVVLKAAAPTLDKKAKKNGTAEEFADALTAQIGQKVDFQLNSVVPNMAGFDTYKMVFTDKVSTGLAIDVSTIELYIDDVRVDSGFTIDPKSASAFTLTITDLKTTAAAKDPGTPIYVSYTATITKDAIKKSDVENKSTLTYDNNPDDYTKHNTVTDEVWVYNFDLDIVKEAKSDHTKLADAEFVLYRKAMAGNDYYYFGDDGLVHWVNAANTQEALDNIVSKPITVSKSAASTGKVSDFKGLPDGTYYLEETKAPDGYNKLLKPLTITINTTFKGNKAEKVHFKVVDPSTSTTILDKDYTITGHEFDLGNTRITNGDVITIENTTGNKLPETGGVGTTIFYTVGALMMAGALVLLITKKKMSVN